MDLLQHLGFPSTFRNWVLALLSTSTLRVLLNGISRDPIKHGRCLRQGDLLSPLLFILAIDPLHHILSKATDQGLLHKLRGRVPMIRTSLYADDAAIFVTTLEDFGNVTRLVTNCENSQVVPIRCHEVDLDNILQAFPANRVHFP